MHGSHRRSCNFKFRLKIEIDMAIEIDLAKMLQLLAKPRQSLVKLGMAAIEVLDF